MTHEVGQWIMNHGVSVLNAGSMVNPVCPTSEFKKISTRDYRFLAVLNQIVYTRWSATFREINLSVKSSHKVLKLF